MTTEPAAAEPGPSAVGVLGAEHFRAIADFTYDWETWVGPAGETLWVNPAVERITGYSVAECLRLPSYPLELVYEPDRPGIRDVLARARASESGNHFEFRVLRKDGSILWAAISWQPLVSARGEKLGYRSSVRDIDERKRLEGELREALRLAESASRAKSEFLANVSHELRTPLTSILGYAQLLGAAELRTPLSSYVSTLIEQGELLDRLVSDLLDYSSLQAGLLPLRAEPYQPEAVLEAVVRALAPVAAKKGLSLQITGVDAPPACEGDPLRISQVLGNLITNAIKFTERGGIEVRVDRLGEAAGYRVTVDDTGPGMPDDESLFSPFRQAPTHAGRYPGGVGLGLAISRQLCERMGGELVSDASPAGGARFVASFPTRAVGRGAAAIQHVPPDAAPAPVSRSFASQYPLAVLVIDDMEPAREFLQAALGALGYEAALAASAEEGYRLAEARPYGLVLVDIQMPGIDGWSAARGLRARLGRAPFVVALTANALANDKAQLEDVGFDGFAQKPLRIRELQALLRRAHERERGASPSGEFDAERWRELSEIVASDGKTLLDRMLSRVGQALPVARGRVEAARAEGDSRELGRALHDLHGLLSLIGATASAACVRRAESAVEHGPVDAPTWAAMQQRLDAVAAELSLRSSQRGP